MTVRKTGRSGQSPVYAISGQGCDASCIWLLPRPDAEKELADLCHSHGLVIERADLLRDLDRLQEATIEKDGKSITARSAVAGQVGSVLQAADRPAAVGASALS